MGKFLLALLFILCASGVYAGNLYQLNYDNITYGVLGTYPTLGVFQSGSEISLIGNTVANYSCFLGRLAVTDTCNIYMQKVNGGGAVYGSNIFFLNGTSCNLSFGYGAYITNVTPGTYEFEGYSNDGANLTTLLYSTDGGSTLDTVPTAWWTPWNKTSPSMQNVTYTQVGDSVTVNFNMTDVYAYLNYPVDSYVIHWGDGTDSIYAPTQNDTPFNWVFSNIYDEFERTHMYTDDGMYPITIDFIMKDPIDWSGGILSHWIKIGNPVSYPPPGNGTNGWWEKRLWWIGGHL